MLHITPPKLAGYIDHTLLKPGVSPQDIDRLCLEAAEQGFASVCLHPHYVARAAERLEGSPVAVGTVVDFPLGAGTKEMKVFSARQSVEHGAWELDMVMNLSLFRYGSFEEVEEEIAAVVRAVPRETVVKVILETCYLSVDEIEKACLIAQGGGAHFVKTSTGFGPAGATLEAVTIMQKTVGGTMGIKAAGGIRTCEQALAMIECGATRIGTSSGVRIVQELRQDPK